MLLLWTNLICLKFLDAQAQINSLFENQLLLFRVLAELILLGLAQDLANSEYVNLRLAGKSLKYLYLNGLLLDRDFRVCDLVATTEDTDDKVEVVPFITDDLAINQSPTVLLHFELRQYLLGKRHHRDSKSRPHGRVELRRQSILLSFPDIRRQS